MTNCVSSLRVEPTPKTVVDTFENKGKKERNDALLNQSGLVDTVNTCSKHFSTFPVIVNGKCVTMA